MLHTKTLLYTKLVITLLILVNADNNNNGVPDFINCPAITDYTQITPSNLNACGINYAFLGIHELAWFNTTMWDIQHSLYEPKYGWCMNGDKIYDRRIATNGITPCEYQDWWSVMILEPELSEMLSFGNEEGNGEGNEKVNEVDNTENHKLTTSVKEIVENLDIVNKINNMTDEDNCIHHQNMILSRLLNSMYIVNCNPVDSMEGTVSISGMIHNRVSNQAYIQHSKGYSDGGTVSKFGFFNWNMNTKGIQVGAKISQEKSKSEQLEVMQRVSVKVTPSSILKVTLLEEVVSGDIQYCGKAIAAGTIGYGESREEEVEGDWLSENLQTVLNVDHDFIHGMFSWNYAERTSVTTDFISKNMADKVCRKLSVNNTMAMEYGKKVALTQLTQADFDLLEKMAWK